MSDGRQHDFDPLVEAEEFERKRNWRPPLEGIDGRYDATEKPELEPSGYNCVPETGFWQTVKLLFCGMVPRKFRKKVEHVTDDFGKMWRVK